MRAAADAAGRVGARVPPVGAAAAVDLRPPVTCSGARLAAPLVEDLNIFHLAPSSSALPSRIDE